MFTQACVRRRAILSVRANPKCPDEAAAARAVNEVWESCFNDTRPFDEVRCDSSWFVRTWWMTLLYIDLLDRFVTTILTGLEEAIYIDGIGRIYNTVCMFIPRMA